jgi:L-ribulokinase
VPSVGSAIFAFLVAGSFKTIEEAQERLCPSYSIVEPDAASALVYNELYALFRNLYFALGRRDAGPAAVGAVLPTLRAIAERQRTGAQAIDHGATETLRH